MLFGLVLLISGKGTCVTASIGCRSDWANREWEEHWHWRTWWEYYTLNRARVTEGFWKYENIWELLNFGKDNSALRYLYITGSQNGWGWERPLEVTWSCFSAEAGSTSSWVPHPGIASLLTSCANQEGSGLPWNNQANLVSRVQYVLWGYNREIV